MKRLAAFGPACIGNMAAGFDVLGVAVAPEGGELWGDVVELAEASRFSLTCDGPFAHGLPASPADNLVLQACTAYERRLGWPLPSFAIRLTKGLPVCSGLGSSSASAVATLHALDVWLGHPLGPDALLAAAGEAEGHASGAVHLDNVAPALLGGLRLVTPAPPDGELQGGAVALPFPPELRFVVASPELSLSTRAARAALPRTLPLGLAVEHAQNLASLVQALHSGDRALLRACLRDLVAEPFRAALVPGFRAVQRAAVEAGAWGCSLSGAGPAVFAVAEDGAAPAVGGAMQRAWADAGVPARVRVCRVDEQGARVVEPCS
jgi:homoserine kinase